MKLSKIYANDYRFQEVVFKEGINMILGVGVNPHSVGKTTLLHLVDYCLLKSDLTELLDNNKLRNFVFFLEIRKKNGEYITIKRQLGSEEVYLKNHLESADLRNDKFEYCAKQKEAIKKLCKELEFSINGVFSQDFRKYLAYFIREKEDKINMFKPSRFQGKDSDWKPFVSSMMGIDMGCIIQKAELDKRKKTVQNTIGVLENEFYAKDIQEKKVIRLIESYQEKNKEIEKNCKALNLFAEDERKQKELVEIIDTNIAQLNMEKYRLQARNRLINQSLKKKQEIELSKIKQIFEDTKTYFPESLVKSFEDVIAFNTKLSSDSSHYLKEEREENAKKLKDINQHLEDENNVRTNILNSLAQVNILEKMKQLMDESSDLKIKIKIQEGLLELFEKYRQKKEDRKEISESIKKLRLRIEQEISKTDNVKLGSFLNLFEKYSQDILLGKESIDVTLNQANNIDFKSRIFDAEERENSKNKGETFSKISSFIFDICTILLHKDDNFINFLFYDGLFDSVAPEFVDRMFKTMKQLEDMGIQIIFTGIEKDIKESGFFNELTENYLLRELSDSNTLFTMEIY